jgi:hypothetical protein
VLDPAHFITLSPLDRVPRGWSDTVAGETVSAGELAVIHEGVRAVRFAVFSSVVLHAKTVGCD